MADKLRIYVYTSVNGTDKEGLELADFEVSLKRVDKSDGATTTVLDAVAMDFESGWGIYGKLYDSPDYQNYDYFSKVEYKGSQPLDQVAWLGGPDDADISSRSTLKAGAIEWTYTLTEDGTGTPISDAQIWVTTDLTGSHVIASGMTDQNGRVKFWLDAGVAYIWAAKAGYNFPNPDTEVVS